MQLARDLHKTRSELLRDIDSREISDWLAFYIYNDEMKKNKEYDNQQQVLQAKFKVAVGNKLRKA